MILMSYVPLGSDKIGTIWPLEKKQKLLESIFEAAKAYPITAIGWMLEEGHHAYPVLILPHALEIAEHMREWAGRKTEKYFTLVWQAQEAGYAITILPDFDKSARRYHAATGRQDSFTILGHVFPYKVPKSDGFNPAYLEGRTTIDVGFLPAMPKPGEVPEHCETVRMRVCPFAALPADLQALVRPNFQTTH
jgi:hypothetical protein